MKAKTKSSQATTKAVKQAAVARKKSRDEMIQEAAYHKAEQRGFEPGHEMEDWLAAEEEVDNGATP